MANGASNDYKLGDKWLFITDERELYYVTVTEGKKMFNKAVEIVECSDGKLDAKYYMSVPIKVMKLIKQILRKETSCDKGHSSKV